MSNLLDITKFENLQTFRDYFSIFTLSVRELVALLIRMRLFTWEQVENLIQNWVILTLEKFLSHPGQAQ